LALNPRRFQRPQRFIREPEHRINRRIQAPEVRLVGDNVEQGVYATDVAIRMAEELGLDLVEISPNAVPPVCRVVEYNKFLYDKKKKDKELKAKTVKQEMKEVRFTPNTGDHDFDFKVKHAINFLQEGNKVKGYLQFRGRAIVFKDRGELLLLKFVDALKDYGVAESMPKLEGNRMHVMINPKSAKGGGKPKPATEQSQN
jgi:translation initiation factor IF-3